MSDREVFSWTRYGRVPASCCVASSSRSVSLSSPWQADTLRRECEKRKLSLVPSPFKQATCNEREWQQTNAQHRGTRDRERGPGRDRALRVETLVGRQEMTRSGRVRISGVPREPTLADLLTKGKARHEIEKLIQRIGGEKDDHRASVKRTVTINQGTALSGELRPDQLRSAAAVRSVQRGPVGHLGLGKAAASAQ